MNDFSDSKDRKSSAYRAFIASREFGGYLGDAGRRVNEALKARVHGTDPRGNFILADEYVVYVYIRPIETDRWRELFKEWRQPHSAFRPYAFHAIVNEKNPQEIRSGYRQVLDLPGNWRTWKTASACIAGQCGFSGSGLVRRILEKALLECRLGRRLEQPAVSQGNAGSPREIQGSRISSQGGQQEHRSGEVDNATRDSVRYDGPSKDGAIHFKVLRERTTHTSEGEVWGAYDRPYVVFEPSSLGILRGRELSFDGADLLQEVFGTDSGTQAELPILDLEALDGSSEAQEEHLGKILADLTK